MEPEARYTVVGVSVLILAAIVTACLVWLLASGNHKDVRPYTLYFAKQSLEGLEVNSEVRMKGIRVGSVAAFKFAKARQGSVEVDVNVDAAAPVRVSTRAVVDRNLITGVATIRLVTVDEHSPLVRELPDAPEAHVILEGESGLQQFSQTVDQLAQRADDTFHKLSTTLSPANQAALTELLENLRVASRQAGQLAERSDGALAEVARAAASFRAAMPAITHDLNTLTARYDALGARAAAGIDKATAALERVSEDATRLSRAAEGLASDASVELQLTGRQLREAADDLSTTSKRLANPRALLLGSSAAELGPGESGE
jgi:phospholipid/cholesterol/gamma-HCH transport system substrate-binding protein